MKRMLLVVLTLTSFAACAQPDTEKLRAELGKSMPNVTVGEIKPTPVPGIYEVNVNNQLVYVTEDGKYLLTGDLIDLAARVNLTEQQREKGMLSAINAMSEDKMIVIGPRNPKHVITVFTDVDCPYCAKLHKEVPELVKNDVKVRYVFFPRAGEGSGSFKRSVAVWCAKDRVAAIGAAKAGQSLEMKTCPNPVSEHLQLAQALQLQGTPTIVSSTGKVIPGFVPAARLLAILEEKGS